MVPEGVATLEKWVLPKRMKTSWGGEGMSMKSINPKIVTSAPRSRGLTGDQLREDEGN